MSNQIYCHLLLIDEVLQNEQVVMDGSMNHPKWNLIRGYQHVYISVFYIFKSNLFCIDTSAPQKEVWQILLILVVISSWYLHRQSQQQQTRGEEDQRWPWSPMISMGIGRSCQIVVLTMLQAWMCEHIWPLDIYQYLFSIFFIFIEYSTFTLYWDIFEKYWPHLIYTPDTLYCCTC